MANLPISGLPAGSPADVNVLAQEVPGIATQKITEAQLKSFIQADLGSAAFLDATQTNVPLDVVQRDSDGNIVASNLTGINHGDLVTDNVINVPNATGMSLTAGSLSDPQKLQLTPADATNPGVVTSGAQTFGGAKVFSGGVSGANLSGFNRGDLVTADVSTINPNSTGMFMMNGSLSDPQELRLCEAQGSFPGVMTGNAQSFDGNKEFTGDITANNLSGTNHGDFTTSAVTAFSNSTGFSLTNGNSVTPQNIALAAADGSNPGALTAIAQTIGGDKTFTGSVIMTTTTGRLKLPVLTTTQRNALTPEEGDVIANSTTHQCEYYNGTAWVLLG
jgi:hypothetical protein